MRDKHVCLRIVSCASQTVYHLVLFIFYPASLEQERHISAAVMSGYCRYTSRGGREGNLRATVRTLVPTHPPMDRELGFSLACLHQCAERTSGEIPTSQCVSAHVRTANALAICTYSSGRCCARKFCASTPLRLENETGRGSAREEEKITFHILQNTGS